MENKEEIRKIIREELRKEEYTGWLVSNSLLKRSLAVLGHYIIWYLIIFIPFFIIMLIFMFMAWMSWILLNDSYSWNIIPNTEEFNQQIDTEIQEEIEGTDWTDINKKKFN